MKKTKRFLCLLLALLLTCNMQVFASDEVEHVYGEPKFVWEYSDYCYALAECLSCEESHKKEFMCDITDVYEAPTCTAQGKRTYTATVEINGVVYSDQSVITHNALGHSFEGTVCTRCGATRNQTTVVTMPAERTVTYSGNAYAIKVQKVEGSTGKITYKYYIDENCKRLTTASNSGAKKEGGAPVKPGYYYVIATVAADENYEEAVTPPSKLTILPRKVLNFKAVNTSSGIKLTWSKRDEVDGYYIYRRTSSTAKWSKIKTLEGKSNTSYTDTGRTNGKKYYYNIVSYKFTYDGWDEDIVLSNKRSKDTQVIHFDLKISNLNGGVKLKWQKCSDTSVKGYYIYRKRAGESKYTKAATISSRSTVTWTDKTSKTVQGGKKAQYYIKVYYGKSNSVVTKSAEYTNYYLGRPTASVSGDYIKWTKVSGASGYEIYENKMDMTIYHQVSNTKTKYKVFDDVGPIYAKVRAYKKVNGKYYYSAWSKEKSDMSDFDFNF